ncbi:MAG: hypothetical protein SPL79_05430 [Sphaerochaetaceae bacterium]|nr:hypothetical protein [Sphaerochaetaceae bacterium]
MRKTPYAGAGMLFWNRDEEGHIQVILGKRAIHHGPGYRQWSIPVADMNALTVLFRKRLSGKQEKN